MKVLKSVLFIVALTVATLAFTTTAYAGPKGPNIVDVAIEVNSSGPFAGQFDTLIAAVLAADPAVLATLTGNGQHTVFAPTDAAFANLGLTEENVGDLPQDALTEILLYHVAKGRRDAGDVTTSSQIRMLNGDRVSVNGAVLTDAVGRNANIIVTDVPAANGIIHAIDEVILPFVP